MGACQFWCSSTRKAIDARFFPPRSSASPGWWQGCGKLLVRWPWEGATPAGLSQLSCLLGMGTARLSHVHSQWH